MVRITQHDSEHTHCSLSRNNIIKAKQSSESWFDVRWIKVETSSCSGGFPKCSAPRQVEVVGCIRGQRWKTLSKRFGPKSQLIFYWKDALNQTRVSAIWCKYNIQYVYLMYDKCWSFNHCLHYCMFLGLSVHLSFPLSWTPNFFYDSRMHWLHLRSQRESECDDTKHTWHTCLIKIP